MRSTDQASDLRYLVDLLTEQVNPMNPSHRSQVRLDHASLQCPYRGTLGEQSLSLGNKTRACAQRNDWILVELDYRSTGGREDALFILRHGASVHASRLVISMPQWCDT